LDPEQRLKLADLVIEHIVDRTQRGLDKDGNPFPKYSKSYINSLDFKNAGKSPGKVDLQLSGDMLASIKLLSQRNGNLMIGFENGTTENSKAEGNIEGSYGRSPNPSKARDFLGIDKQKLNQLIDFVYSEYGSSTTEGDNSGENQ
jgi:hypothetical protein